jgi:tetratricopeptide (TPR) repeat protein
MGRASRTKKERGLPPPAEPAVPSSPDPDPSREEGMNAGRPRWLQRPLLIILVAAAIFRILYSIQFRTGTVFQDSLLLDAWIYDDWARRIAAGEWIPSEPFYFAPGYPYALAIFYKFVSSSLGAVYIFQFLLGLLNIALVHRLASVSFGAPHSTVAAALTALYASLPFMESKIMSATLALSTLLLAMVVLEGARVRGGLRRWAVAGLLMGITSLIRPETLLTGPFLLAWLYGWGCPPAAGRSWWRRLRPTALAAGGLVLGWAIAVAPAAAHNVSKGAGSTLISSQGGITFYQSNNPRAKGLYVFLSKEGFSGAPEKQAKEEKEIAEKALGRPLSRSESSSYWFRRGLGFIRDQPGRFLWLLGMKLLRYAGSYEYSTEYIIYVERETVWLLWLPFVPFALLFSLAVPSIYSGLRVGSRPRRGRGIRLNPAAWLLLIMLASNLAACLAFYISSRYRLPSVPPLIVFASATLVSLWGDYRRGRRFDLAAKALIVGVMFIGAHLEKDESARIQEANVHYNSGNLWAGKNDHEKALEEFERALSMDNSRYTTWFNMGNSLQALERYSEAAEAYGTSGRRRKSFLRAHLREGSMWSKAGDLEKARAAFQRAAGLRPGSFEAHLGLGRVAARLGDRGVAVLHLDRALEIRPDSEAARRERERL